MKIKRGDLIIGDCESYVDKTWQKQLYSILVLKTPNRNKYVLTLRTFIHPRTKEIIESKVELVCANWIQQTYHK